jgi:hypothetical protein
MRYNQNKSPKRAESVEIMKKITEKELRDIADYMNDEIREELHAKLAPCTPEEFLREYIKRDPEILDILRNEFNFDI